MTRSIHWASDPYTPYNAGLFRALAADPEIHLTVHYIRKCAGTHPWRTISTEGFDSREYRRRLGIDWRLIQIAVAEPRSLLATGSWHEPTIQTALSLRRLLHRSYLLWTDTPALHRKRHPVKAFLRAVWLRWLFRQALAVMGTGAPALAALEQMGCPPSKLVNFPYYIDVDRYRARDWQKRHPELVYFSSGRLHPQKGYDMALRALAAAYRGRSTGFIYRIAGTGPQAQQLVQLAGDLGIDRRVEFLGWVEQDDMIGLYAEADVLLHPARFEPYGVAVLEAMAAGLVVVGSDVTAAAVDRIAPTESGLLHRSGDVDDLTSCIEWIVAHPESLPQIGQRARRAALEWPLERAVATIKAILREG